MIGYYNYTVILTYLSLLSGGLGIMVSLNGPGHPYLGIFCLLFCGLCDSFDGKVARTKKNRSPQEQKFGIQIDSLSDLVAFGVLPACIGNAMMRVSSVLPDVPELKNHGGVPFPVAVVLWGILVLYILATMIRLAHFNVMEEERQETEEGTRKYYTGLPVTSSALIFPTVMLLQYLIPADISVVYFIAMIVTGFMFLGKFQIRKPGMKGIMFLIGIGAAEFILFITFWLMRH